MKNLIQHNSSAGLCGEMFDRPVEMTAPRVRGSRRGFSLIEMLTLITVIGVISAIAIPRISYMKMAAIKATELQNAENIVSMFTAGRDGGSIEWVTTSRNACVADVVAGRAAPASSIFAGKVFRVPNVKDSSLTGVYKYIGLDARKSLFFDKSGGQPPN